MNKDDQDIEIIDAFENTMTVFHKTPHNYNDQEKKKENNKKKNIKYINKNKSANRVSAFKGEVKTNRMLQVSLILLPIVCLVYVISLHSNNLINGRVSTFSLVLIGLLLVSFIIGLVRFFKTKQKISYIILKMSFASMYVLTFVAFGFLLYGNDSTIRDYIIDKAMMTSKHQYLAFWLFDDDTISESLTQLKQATKVELDGSDKIEFEDITYNPAVYANKYEEDILKKDNANDLYKIIKISGKTIGADHKYRGYLVAVYDPSRVKIATSTGAGTNEGSYGEILSIIAKKNNAKIAMNAGGFYDPFWNSNGGIPHGVVIKDGVVKSEFRRGISTGGMIAFTNDNKLILKRMTAEEALAMGVRDAVDWGPFLIVNGKNQFANVKYYSWATSRTAIGQRKDGIVLLLVIDGGNQPGSFGASYADVAKIMENYGAINAANMDGGTSTALVEDNKYVNTPWNGQQRTIRSLPNAWIVK